MNPISNLTNQEIKIVSLILKGLKSKQIADELFISTHTVKNHKTNFCIKLNLNSMFELYSQIHLIASILQIGGG